MSQLRQTASKPSDVNVDEKTALRLASCMTTCVLGSRLGSRLGSVFCRAMALTASVSLLTVSPIANAKPAEPEVTAQQERARLESMFREAMARYSASDYPGAIAQFVDCLAFFESSRQGSPEIRGGILYNLALSYERAYDTEQQTRFLRLARDTYARYVREAEQGFPYQDEAKVRQELARLDALLASLPPAAETTPAPVASKEQPATRVAVQQPTISPADRKKISRRTVGGVVSLSIGGLGAATAIGSAIYGNYAASRHSTVALSDPAAGERWKTRGETSNVMAFVGAGVGAVGLITGVTLLVSAKMLRKSATLAWVPQMNVTTPAMQSNHGWHVQLSWRL